MERNIKSEIDIFLSNLKIGIILKDSNKIRSAISKKMPKIEGINKLKEAMQLHKLAYQFLKEENEHISKEMLIINKSMKLNKAIMPTKQNPICKLKA